MIWSREVNLSMLNYTKTLMGNLTDHNGQDINAKTFIIKPNSDIIVESYPSVSISLDKINDSIGFNDFNSYTIEQVSEDVLSKRLKPTKYSFNYTISFWADNPIHLDSMTKQWVMHNPKYKFIDVVDVDTDITYECKLIQTASFEIGGLTKASNGQNIFRHIINCHVIVGVDNNPSKNYTVVKNINSTKEDV